MDTYAVSSFVCREINYNPRTLTIRSVWLRLNLLDSIFVGTFNQIRKPKTNPIFKVVHSLSPHSQSLSFFLSFIPSLSSLPTCYLNISELPLHYPLTYHSLLHTHFLPPYTLSTAAKSCSFETFVVDLSSQPSYNSAITIISQTIQKIYKLILKFRFEWVSHVRNKSRTDHLPSNLCQHLSVN